MQAVHPIDLHPQVSGDLLEITVYLRDHGSPRLASMFVVAFEKALASIAEMPTRGSIRLLAGIDRGVRSVAVGRFRRHLVFYTVDAGRIRVLAVVHGARDLDKLVAGRAD